MINWVWSENSYSVEFLFKYLTPSDIIFESFKIKKNKFILFDIDGAPIMDYEIDDDVKKYILNKKRILCTFNIENKSGFKYKKSIKRLS